MSDAVVYPELWDDVLKSLEYVMRAELVSIILRRDRPYARLSGICRQHDTQFVSDHDSYYVFRDPVRLSGIKVTEKAFTLTDVFSLSELEKFEYYSDFVKPTRQLSLKIRRQVSPNHALSMNLTLDRNKPCTREQRQLLEILSEHQRRIFVRAMNSNPFGLNDFGMLEAEQAGETAFLILGNDHRVLTGNLPAYQLLSSRSEIYIDTDSKVKLSDVAVDHKFQQVIDQCATPAPSMASGLLPSIEVKQQSGIGSFFIQSVGLKQNYAPLLFGTPTAIVYIKTSDGWSPPPIRAIQRRFALSKRQAEVVYWRALGDLPEAIAEKFGISVDTIKNHRKNAFSKLGVSNRNDLVRLLKTGCSNWPH